MSVKARAYRDPRPEVSISFDDPSLAVQASKDECDINVIVKKYLQTGEDPNVRKGVYADVSELTDLATAIQMSNFAHQAFMELPADVRRYFDNDPVKLVAFADDPRNYEKAVELGLANPRPPSQPPKSSSAGGQPAPQPAKGGSEPTTT